MAQELRCKETNAAGEPCGASPSFVDPETRLCTTHQPGARERLSEQGKKGAKATKKKWDRPGLTPDQLGELEDVGDVKRWIALITGGVLSGQVDQKDATAATRALKVWLNANEHEGEYQALQEELEELRDRLEKGEHLRAAS